MMADQTTTVTVAVEMGTGVAYTSWVINEDTAFAIRESLGDPDGEFFQTNDELAVMAPMVDSFETPPIIREP